MNIKLDSYDQYLEKINSSYVELKNKNNKNLINNFLISIDKQISDISVFVEQGFKGMLKFDKNTDLLFIKANDNIYLTIDMKSYSNPLRFMFLNNKSFKNNIPDFKAIFFIDQNKTSVNINYNDYFPFYIKEHEIIYLCQLIERDIEIKMKNIFNIFYKDDFLNSINYFYQFMFNNKDISFEKDFVDIMRFKEQEDLFILKYDASKVSDKKIKYEYKIK